MKEETSESYKYLGEPLRVGVVGLVHTHVHWILGREDYGDIDIVGIVEPNRELAEEYSKMHGYSMEIVFDTIEEMVEATMPEAVTAFNTIYDHLSVVEFCAPKGIHVMVEKPLAVNLDHALKMKALADEYGIELLTNYETSWYGSTYDAYKLAIEENKLGDVRKMEFNTGHQGPKEIGVNQEFLVWLTDPKFNGAGALTDFGCYGANIATWFYKDEDPISVTCITQQIKPDIYPYVDDNATIIVNYETAQVIIQASWNWSHSRKEMEVYGTTGYVICKNGEDMEVQFDEEKGSDYLKANSLPKGIHDPFAYLTMVVKEGYQIEPYGLASLENNIQVMRILEAARISDSTNQKFLWSEYGK